MLTEVLPPAFEASTVPPAKRPVRSRLFAAATPYLYLFPALLALGIWVYRPLLLTVEYSFDNWNLVPSSPRINVGWSNYIRVLHLPALWRSLGVSAFYLFGLIIFGVVVPVIIAVLTQNLRPRSQVIYRALVFVPVLVSPIVAAAIWNFLFVPDGGLINTVLSPFGGGQINWFNQGSPARLAIVFTAGWKIVGFSALIVSAGLASVSPDYYEAAEVDGARRKQVFWRVTLPLLSPTILFLVIAMVLLSSQLVFPLINALTQGGPVAATTDIYYFLYTYGFSSFDVGLASAAAVMFFIVFGAAALVLVRLLDRLSFYDS